MGVYDTISMPGTPADGAQVKLWGSEMEVYGVGDEVPPLPRYGVVLREGGAILVDDGILIGWVQELPTDRPLLDKWGDVWFGNEENTGALGEPYFYKQDEDLTSGVKTMSVPTEEEQRSMFCPFDGQPLDIQQDEENSVITESCPDCDIEWEWRPKDNCLVPFDQPA